MKTIDQDQFLSKFSEMFDDTDPSAIAISTEYKNLDEWSSMMALSLIAMVDEEYDVKISGDDIRNSKTVGEIFNCVNNKLN